MRDERPTVPSQEELPIWRIPAAAPAPEEPRLLQGKLVASGFASYASLQRVVGLPSAPVSFMMTEFACRLPL